MPAGKNIPTDQEFAEIVDAMLLKLYKPDGPGAAVIVTRKGKPVFRKGYGMANIELGVRIEPHMVFRLGSITKQFTAVAVLMLMEQGKLDLQDEITKFLPDYPTHGHRITIEHLLTHTSGIKSYTNMPDFRKMIRGDLELQALVDTFKPCPMEFAPGEQFNYNNSAYVMLGLIIEKASGMKHAEFLQKNIFEPLGMTSSCFDMPNPILSGRVAGYKPAGEGRFENSDYISMTLPHAAGSLASSVDDMAKWDAALYTEKLVKQSSLKKAWTSGVLKDGTETGYGYGWGISSAHGYYMIAHNGGVNGFMSDAVRFPNEEVYVCVLTNSERPAMSDLAFRIGAIAIGRPFDAPAGIPFDPALYDNYQGVYRIQHIGAEVPLVRAGDKLILMMPSGKEELAPLSKTEFASKQSTSVYRFKLDENGRARAMTIVMVIGVTMTADMTDKPLPEEHKAVEVGEAVLAQYVGEYELVPGVKMALVLKDGKLTAQIPGQPAFELHAESETKFFLEEVPVSMEFQKDASGKVTGMKFNQAGNEMQAKKIK